MDWAVHIVIAVLIALFIVNYVGQRTIVDGSSMLPTLQHGNHLIIEKISPRFGKINRGDIVVVYVPEFIGEQKKQAIKRVIGLGGDKIEIIDGKVFLNGKMLKEDYINGDITPVESPQYSKIDIPEGCIFVMGDNRQDSFDSRRMGPLSVKKVRGKAVLRYWPLKEFETLKNR